MLASVHVPFLGCIALSFLRLAHTAPVHGAQPAAQVHDNDPVLPWIDATPAQSLTAIERQVFARPLNIDLDPALKLERDLGSHNDGLYRLPHDYIDHAGKEYQKDLLILKVLKSLNDDSFLEVKALKMVRAFVDSGSLMVSGVSKPVIVMKFQPGEMLPFNEYYIQHPEQQQTMSREAQLKGCDAAAEIGTAHKVFHLFANPRAGKVLVNVDVSDGNITSSHLVGWGPQSVVFLKPGHEPSSSLLRVKHDMTQFVVAPVIRWRQWERALVIEAQLCS
ncbi:hypothetical protein C8R42DRAFT_647995 [Lentinula raphanica]|nr:hypothetical protein C8R42DRAFT_647995 [Lentinula raphanica]